MQHQQRLESRVIISLYHISDRNQWNLRDWILTITIRYIDLGQIIGFDLIFQSIMNGVGNHILTMRCIRERIPPKQILTRAKRIVTNRKTAPTKIVMDSENMFLIISVIHYFDRKYGERLKSLGSSRGRVSHSHHFQSQND